MSAFPDWPELPDPRELHRRLWQPEPLEPPEADLELTPDHWVERGAEVIGWSLARLEYWLSQGGWLRAWLRLNLFLGAALAIAGLLLLPPAAQVIEQLARSGHWLSALCRQLIGTLAVLPPAVLSLGLCYLAFVVARRHFQRRRLQRERRGGHYEDERYYQ
jgi:hypothetical protein